MNCHIRHGKSLWTRKLSGLLKLQNAPGWPGALLNCSPESTSLGEIWGLAFPASSLRCWCSWSMTYSQSKHEGAGVENGSSMPTVTELVSHRGKFESQVPDPKVPTVHWLPPRYLSLTHLLTIYHAGNLKGLPKKGPCVHSVHGRAPFMWWRTNKGSW